MPGRPPRVSSNMKQSIARSQIALPDSARLVDVGAPREVDVGEPVLGELGEVAVRHAGDVVDDRLVQVARPIVHAVVVRELLGEPADVVPEDVARLVARREVRIAALVHELERARQKLGALALDAARAVDLPVVLRLRAAELGEQLLAHLDAVLAVAVLDDVGRGMREDPRVVRAAETVLEGVPIEQACLDGVLAVAAHVGDDVGDAHHAALERHGAQVPDGAPALRVALLDRRVELLEAGEPRELEHALLVLAVVAEHPIERLERDVAAVEHVEHADGVDVVVERATRARLEHVVQAALAGVSERRVPKVVPEPDGLDEVAVEPERVADVARDAGDELDMETAAREVVVRAEAEDLRLAGVAVVCGQVEDLLHIAHEGRPPEARLVARALLAPERGGIVRPVRVDPSAGAVAPHALDELGRERIGDGRHALAHHRTVLLGTCVHTLPFPQELLVPSSHTARTYAHEARPHAVGGAAVLTG